MADDDVTVTVAHLREAQMCIRGAKQWARYMGLDFDAFVRHGIPASQLEATGDAFALQVAKIARDEAKGED